MRAKIGVLTALVTVAGASLVGGFGLVGGAVAADKQGACVPAEDQIRAVTLNVQALPLMPRDKVVADVDKAAGLGADVLMWQEIQPDYYKDAVRAEKLNDPKRGEWRTFQLDLAVPISVRLGGDSPWEYVSDGRKLMHGGREKVSPNRYISWVVLKDRSSGRKTVFMNTHMVSGAWNGKENTADPWRKEMWQQHRTEQTRVIDDFNAKGMSVVYGGDFNRQNVAPFSARDKQVVDTGIDHLGVVLAPGDTLPAVQKKQSVGGFNSDHPAKLMKATVSGCRPGAGTPKPTTSRPTTGKPTTKAPTTKAPTGQPTTKAPTKAPTTKTPTKMPTTQAPPTKAPTTQAPTTQAPPTKAPTTQVPTTQAPPTTKATSTQGPTTQAPPAVAPTTRAPRPAPAGGPGTEPAPGVPDVPADGAGVPDVKTPEHTGGLASTGR